MFLLQPSINFALRRLNLLAAFLILVLLTGSLSITTYAFASSTSNFTQTINSGTLAVDIVNGSYTTVASPSMAMSAATFSFSCQTATGTFGTSTEQLYVTNPDAADSGWVVSLAASDPTDVWDSAGTDFDFNDPGTSGCVDDGATTDTDNLGGQMTVDAATGGTLSAGNCASCDTTSVTLGSSASFEEDTTDSITIVTGASGSDDIGDWTVQDIDISQKIPAEQPAAADYDIDMVLSIVAS